MRFFTSVVTAVATPSGPGGTGILPALLVTALLTSAGVVVAGFSGGSSAAYGVLVGAVAVVVVFSFGMAVTHAAAALSPAMSLLVALLTYLLQLVLLVVVLTSLERSGLLGATLDREWIGGTIIVGTLVWSWALVRAATRRTALYHSSADEVESTGSTSVTDRPGGGTAG